MQDNFSANEKMIETDTHCCLSMGQENGVNLRTQVPQRHDASVPVEGHFLSLAGVYRLHSAPVSSESRILLKRFCKYERDP